MTPEETTRAVELVVQSQQVMDGNIDSLFQTARMTAESTAENSRGIGALAQRVRGIDEQLGRLAQLISDYIRGLRNGHNAGH